MPLSDPLLLLREQLDANYERLNRVLIPTPVLTLLIGWPLLGSVSVVRVGGWFLLVAFSSGIGVWLRARYFSVTRALVDEPSDSAVLGRTLQRWARIRKISATVHGLAWGGFPALLLFVPDRLDLQLTTLCAVALTCVGPLATSAVFFSAFAGYTIGCLAPLLLRMSLPGSLVPLPTALTLWILLAVLLRVGRALSRSAVEQLRLLWRNEQLVSRLERAQGALELSNRELLGRVEQRSKELSKALEEKHRSELQLAQSYKMEAVGRLAGGVAHDFNNLLTAILGSASLVLEDLPQESTYRPEIEDIVQGAERASRLTARLLTLAKGGLAEPVHVDVASHVRDLAQLLSRIVRPSNVLEVQVPDSEVVVLLDPSQLDQLVLNLVLNAKEASSVGQEITLRVTTGQGRALLQVIDRGVGVEPKLLGRIFEPLFTTKGERGTGLGLSTCFGIVQRAAGDLTVTSTVGEGSTFVADFPLQDARASYFPQRISEIGEWSAKRALVVEDQEPVLRLIASTLRRNGTSVLEARSAEEASQLWGKGLPDVELVISDVQLPGRSGFDLLTEMNDRGYSGVFLLVSGYIDQELLLRRHAGRGAPLLPKPFTPTELEHAVGAAFARAMQAKTDAS